MKRGIILALGLACLVATAAVLAATGGNARKVAMPMLHPSVNDYQQLTTGETPPTEAQCFSAGRRCFAPQAMRAAYNIPPLYQQGFDGRGYTIAIIDSFGSDTMAHDLHVFDTQFGLQSMCGEEGVTCAAGMPTFSQLSIQGSPATKSNGNGGIGLENKTAWALEVALDVEWAHATAPGANILLVHTPTAETLGLQGFPQMMMAEDYVVTHHLADVISQSLGSSEDAFGSAKSLLNLRYAFQDAKDNNVTVLASTGDFGSSNETKQSLTGAGAGLLPTPNIGWPASDPLVTAVGGTYLCTDPNATTSRTVDSTDPPTTCRANPGVAEIGWIAGGGGFSHIFPRPDFQNQLPPGSTAIPADSRGIPDIAYQASARTGALIYLTLPPDGNSGLICPGGNPCSTGWYDIGGTSASAPQWAGLVAIADQIAGHRLGYINPALYQLAANSTTYANDFYDITVGNNVALPDFPTDYFASKGWDPVTGLGTPNAAKLLPDLAAAAG